MKFFKRKPKQAQTDEPLNSFKKYWPYYLREHSNPKTRLVHALGTAVGVVGGVSAAVLATPFAIPAAIVGIYGVLTWSHKRYQGNIPATFQKGSIKNVLWAAAGDFKMVGMWYAGKVVKKWNIESEYRRHGLDPTGSGTKGEKRKIAKAQKKAQKNERRRTGKEERQAQEASEKAAIKGLEQAPDIKPAFDDAMAKKEAAPLAKDIPPMIPQQKRPPAAPSSP